MKAIIIGAGIVGATTAATLAKKGYEVTVIDQDVPASGASYANGGQLSACHTTPWANPSAPGKVLKWALSPGESPLIFRPHADLHQLSWLAKFLWNCLPGKTKSNTEQLLALALHSRQARKDLQVGLDRYHGLNNGILHFYRTKKELNDAQRDVTLMQEHGLDRTIVTVEKALEIEPALKPIASELVGATFTSSDSSGDAAEFTRFLLKTEWVAMRGIKGSIKVQKGTVCGLKDVDGQAYVLICDGIACKNYTMMTADVVVVANGVQARDLVKSIGVNLDIYPARGFSATIDLHNVAGKRVKGPTVSLTDDERKLVYSRLGHDLRVAGTASLNGYSNTITDADKPRCDNMLRAARETFGLPSDLAKVTFWSGLRPLTPSNRPYVCGTHLPNLFLNTGHGSLGWTMSAGSADLLSCIIEGSGPPIDPTPYSLKVAH